MDRADTARDGAIHEDALPEQLYAQLRAIAKRVMRSESVAHTLQPTALVHEAFLRLKGSSAKGCWRDRSEFVAAATSSMRRLLIDYARARSCTKRGGELRRVDIELDLTECGLVDLEEYERVDAALDALAVVDARKAKLVELRFHAGFTLGEAAKQLGVSFATAKRDWEFARAWLFRRLTAASPD